MTADPYDPEVLPINLLHPGVRPTRATDEDEEEDGRREPLPIERPFLRFVGSRLGG